MTRAQRARQRRYDRQQQKRQQALRRERIRVAKIADALHRVLRDGLSERDKRFGKFFAEKSAWGERALDAFSRAERAIAEARRFGSR